MMLPLYSRDFTGPGRDFQAADAGASGEVAPE